MSLSQSGAGQRAAARFWRGQELLVVEVEDVWKEGLLLHEILTAAEQLPDVAVATPAVADAAAKALAAQLPKGSRARRCLLIVEGLCKVVQAFARSTRPSRLPREEKLGLIRAVLTFGTCGSGCCSG
eukprot:s1803_g1.t1